ncbi:MAG: outer membrane protein assembly factor BamE, partial [Betaproteobacteria bacterium]|nr:outer membrane protein assembly factor BamE [Betaproteobacteria bacterium]
MTVSKTLRALSTTLVCLGGVWGLTACGSFQGFHSDSFKPYVPEVLQGNVVSREQRQYLRLGMSRAQVRDVLGTPLLTSLFHADRWDYAFAIRRQGVAEQKFHLTVFFQGDALSRIEGD